MQISNDKAVTMEYTLHDDRGVCIDTSKDREPFSYIHGAGSIIPGLEAALAGKSAGDSFNVTIEPADAYGERDDSLLMQIPRERFDVEDIQPGMQFRVGSDTGMHIVTVMKIDENSVTIDGNHPLAGMTLHFDVRVTGVREATEEELSHGHSHECGCGED